MIFNIFNRLNQPPYSIMRVNDEITLNNLIDGKIIGIKKYKNLETLKKLL
jgi:hypothetical protein